MLRSWLCRPSKLNVLHFVCAQIPVLEPLYKTYSRTHSAALTHLQRLSLSPVFWSYPSDVRSFLSSDTRIPDLPFFLMKPEQRVPEYCRLLDSIIDTTPISHRDFAALVEARDQMDKVARDLDDVRESVRGILPKTIPTFNGTNGPGNTEANKLAQLESRLDDYVIFSDRFAECVKDWEIATRRSVESLQQWGITFGAVLALAPPSSAPYHPAYQVFISLLYSLRGLCRTLEDDLQTTFQPLLRKLKAMTKHPKRLLNEMHSLELPPSPLARFWRPDTSKNHHRYLAIRSTLLSQLPVFLDAMDRAIELAVRIMTQRQVTFLDAVRSKWIHLFNSLKEEGEHYGGTEETLRAWQVRWAVGRQMLLIWGERYLGESAVREVSPATSSEINPPAWPPAMSAGLPPVNGEELDHEQWKFA